MVFQVIWTFLDANSGDPIFNIPIVISHSYDNANCFGAVNNYPPETYFTDSSGQVSMSFGSGACGSDNITAAFDGNGSYYANSDHYITGANRGGTTNRTVNLVPVKVYTIPTGPPTTTGQTGSGNASGAITGGTTSQTTSSVGNSISSMLKSLGASAQTDIEIIGVIAALIIVVVVIVLVMRMRMS